MTAPDLEQALTQTLRRRAEVAMTDTDTRVEHERLEERLAGELPRRRRRVVVGTLVASAAAVAAGVWVAGVVVDRGPDPAQPSSAERVADEFFAAVAAGDADLAASYVAPGTVPWGEYELEMRRDAAWDVEYLLEPCQELSTSLAGTNVVCAFQYYSLGSDELGLEPFGQNSLSLRVLDGQVVHAQPTYNAAANGEDELYDTIGAWVRENHPGDWELMDTEGTPPENDRWFRLWERRIDEYVAEQARD